MLCPRHNVVCDTVVLKSITVEVCPVCQGIWIEQYEMRKLVQYFSVPAIGLSEEQLARWEEVVGNPETAPKDFWQEDILVCPFDGVQMKKHYFAGTTIGLDQCPLCKRFWIDGPEVMAIAKAVGPDPVQDAMGGFILDQVTYPEIERSFQNQTAIELFADNPDQFLWSLAQMAIGYYLGR
jgi:Zn-finger nucleic acid-binding protein